MSMGFSRQECWSGFLFPSPGNLPDPGIEPTSPALAGGFFTTASPGKPIFLMLAPKFALHMWPFTLYNFSSPTKQLYKIYLYSGCFRPYDDWNKSTFLLNPFAPLIIKKDMKQWYENNYQTMIWKQRYENNYLPQVILQHGHKHIHTHTHTHT